jgi:hypothetical protein
MAAPCRKVDVGRVVTRMRYDLHGDAQRSRKPVNLGANARVDRYLFADATPCAVSVLIGTRPDTRGGIVTYAALKVADSPVHVVELHSGGRAPRSSFTVTIPAYSDWLAGCELRFGAMSSETPPRGSAQIVLTSAVARTWCAGAMPQTAIHFLELDPTTGARALAEADGVFAHHRAYMPA